MFSPRGPSLRELAVQALSSVEGGYDLLAPKFDGTPFPTPGGVLDATAGALRPLGPFGRGLDVCCGTGAGMRVLLSLCQGPVTGVDFSAGMLARARSAHPDARWVRADVRVLPFAGAFDLAVSFGALGHFLPAERPALFAGVYRALRPGGVFAFPVGAPRPVSTRRYELRSPSGWSFRGSWGMPPGGAWQVASPSLSFVIHQLRFGDVSGFRGRAGWMMDFPQFRLAQQAGAVL